MFTALSLAINRAKAVSQCLFSLVHSFCCVLQCLKTHLVKLLCEHSYVPNIRPHKDLLTIVKSCKLKWYGQVACSLGLAKPSCKTQWKGEEDKADRKRGRKTTLGNGQAWSSLKPRGQWRTGKKGGNWLWSHPLCPKDPHGSEICEGEGRIQSPQSMGSKT